MMTTYQEGTDLGPLDRLPTWMTGSQESPRPITLVVWWIMRLTDGFEPCKGYFIGTVMVAMD